MISDKLAMFPIALDDITAEEGMPFPVYLHLTLNKRYVPIHHSGDPVGPERVTLFRAHNIEKLWIPDSFRAQYEEYMRRFAPPPPAAAPTPEPAPAPAPPEPPKLSEPDADGIYEETELVAEVLTDDNLSTEAKAEILASLGQDLLRSFNQISNRGEEAQKEAVKRGRQIADEILAIASQDSNIYDEILALRQSKADIEHSIMVSTLTVMFGLALGYTDETMLADMATAGLFHDIGLTRVNPMVLSKPENQWSAQDVMQYQEHVAAGLEVLRTAKVPYHPIVFVMIEQHHENYDGSGFPNMLQGAKITEASQLLHLANWFDRLTAGKLDGAPLAPSESLDRIFKETISPKSVKEVQPELVQRVFQFMLDEKEAAENLLNEATERAAFVSTEKLKAAG